MKVRVHIPALCGSPIIELGAICCTSQPIMQLKELEVDRARYDVWKAWIAKCALAAESAESAETRVK